MQLFNYILNVQIIIIFLNNKPYLSNACLVILKFVFDTCLVHIKKSDSNYDLLRQNKKFSSTVNHEDVSKAVIGDLAIIW